MSTNEVTNDKLKQNEPVDLNKVNNSNTTQSNLEISFTKKSYASIAQVCPNKNDNENSKMSTASASSINDKHLKQTQQPTKSTSSNTNSKKQPTNYHSTNRTFHNTNLIKKNSFKSNSNESIESYNKKLY